MALSNGKETILWSPDSITNQHGEAAPGVGAASYHPSEDKVIFMSGPDVRDIPNSGYYSLKNRTAIEVSGDGAQYSIRLECRDIKNKKTLPGSHRGSTHRDQYSKNGFRIGFTYDDFLNQNYDRTIGFLQESNKAPLNYTHYFSLILRPAQKGFSKAGELEKAYDDSWIDNAGELKAFIGKVRAVNGRDYEESLFTAHIPQNIDLSTANSGSEHEYPTAAKGISITRLTHSKSAKGVVRGSQCGTMIAYLDLDKNGIQQVFIIPTTGSDLSTDITKQPRQLTSFKSDASSPRWGRFDRYIYSISQGNIAQTEILNDFSLGKTIILTDDNLIRSQLVVSPDGQKLAYNITMKNDGDDKAFQQIFIYELKL